jgi:hypothetical protein
MESRIAQEKGFLQNVAFLLFSDSTSIKWPLMKDVTTRKVLIKPSDVIGVFPA